MPKNKGTKLSLSSFLGDAAASSQKLPSDPQRDRVGDGKFEREDRPRRDDNFGRGDNDDQWRRGGGATPGGDSRGGGGFGGDRGGGGGDRGGGGVCGGDGQSPQVVLQASHCPNVFSGHPYEVHPGSLVDHQAHE